MIRRAIVAYPQSDNLHLLDPFRERYDPLAAVIPPHFTFVFPFESELAAEQLRTHIQQAITGLAPFRVELHGFTGSEGEYVFLNVKRGNDQIIELHDRLYLGLLAAYRSLEHTYVPHITAGRCADRATFLEALAATQKITAVFKTTLNEVALYSLDDHSTEFRVELRAKTAG
jgi:2'-5' RNA ligase